MNKYLIVFAAAAVASAAAANCGQELGTLTTCFTMTTQKLDSIQPDGRKDLMERKGCNLLEDLLKCGEAVDSSCKNTQFNDMWSQMSGQMLESMKTLPGWDSNKCPAAQTIMNGSTGVAASALTLLALVLAQLAIN